MKADHLSFFKFSHSRWHEALSLPITVLADELSEALMLSLPIAVYASCICNTELSLENYATAA
jgi:hypothetical protein